MNSNGDKIITMADLQKDFEAERRHKGETVIKPRNGDNNFALQDKSFKSSVDFMRKFVKRIKEEEQPYEAFAINARHIVECLIKWDK